MEKRLYDKCHLFWGEVILARGGRKRIRIPKLLSPVNSFEGAVGVIRAGADEIYCGVAIPGKLKNFTIYRGPGASPAQLPTYDELGKIVNYAHRHNVKVIVTVNEPFMSKVLDKTMRSHIRSCLDEGVDALIVGDFGVLSIIKDLGVDVPLIASTYFVSMNYEAVNFLGKLGFSRVILERHLTLQEISEIVNHSNVPIEVFCHAGGCSNINANCYFYHYGIFSKLLGSELRVSKHVKSVIAPCTLFYDVYDVNDEETKLCNIPILDAFTFCSLCHIPALVRIGVSGLKIVGRFKSAQEQEIYTLVYRELLDTIVKERGNVNNKRVLDKIKSLRRRLDKLEIDRAIGNSDEKKPKIMKGLNGRIKRARYEVLQGITKFPFRDIYCEQKRCLYGPLFNVPYKHFTSWDPRKLQS